MMVHLGDDFLLRVRDIVMMISLAQGDSQDTRSFLDAALERGAVQRISQDPPKTAVIAHSKLGQAVYLSSISAATLQRRLEELK